MKGYTEPQLMPGERSGQRVIWGLSEPAIRRGVRFEALQHPATLLPLSVLIASGIYLLVLSPVFGGGFWAIWILVVCAVVAAVSFVWHYFFRYAEEYAKRIRELVDLQDRESERAKQAEICQLRQSLQGEFSTIESTEGLEALSSLVGGYEQLQPSLRQHSHPVPLSISHIPGLAEETYQRGLSVLSDALELLKVTQAPGRERLERETAELEKEVETSKVDESQSDRLSIKEEILSSHRQRLDMLDQLQVRVDPIALPGRPMRGITPPHSN